MGRNKNKTRIDTSSLITLDSITTVTVISKPLGRNKGIKVNIRKSLTISSKQLEKTWGNICCLPKK